MKTLTLTGTVTGRSEGHYAVRCPNAPDHLRVLYLTPRQAGDATIGDRVTLSYFSTGAYGVWNVTAVLPREQE